MNKLSNAQLAEVMSDAAATLRTQNSYIGELEEKLASLAQRDRVTKLASEMHRKGLELDTSVDLLADRLEKSAAAGKLDTIEQAVDFYGPDMGSKLASLTTDVPGSFSGASSDLEQYITGSVG